MSATFLEGCHAWNVSTTVKDIHLPHVHIGKKTEKHSSEMQKKKGSVWINPLKGFFYFFILTFKNARFRAVEWKNIWSRSISVEFLLAPCCARDSAKDVRYKCKGETHLFSSSLLKNNEKAAQGNAKKVQPRRSYFTIHISCV